MWVHRDWDSQRIAWGYNLNERIKLVYNCNEWDKIKAIKETKEQEQNEVEEDDEEKNVLKHTRQRLEKNQQHQKYPIVCNAWLNGIEQYKG